MWGVSVSVIDCLSAGFRFVGRRVELLILPILLDAFVWLTPRLSVAPLLERLSNFYMTYATMPGIHQDTATLYQQLAAILKEMGDSTNLLSMLANQSLLHVPSIAGVLSPLQSNFWEIKDPGIALVLAILFSLAGMLIGVLYLQTLALYLPLGSGDKRPSLREFGAMVLQHWLWLLLFVLILSAALLLLAIPVTVMMLILAIISPALLSGLALMLSGGLTLLLLLYMVFVVAGLILDNLTLATAMWRSVMLLRHNLWSTLGFLGLTYIITNGFGLLWQPLVSVGANPAGLLIAVLGNSYIGAGLAMGLLVFYRTRLLRTANELQAAGKQA